MGNLFDKIKKQTERHAHVLGIKPKEVKEMTMREMLAKTRKPTLLTEAEINLTSEPKVMSGPEKARQEDEMSNYFAEDEVTIQFNDLLVADNYIFFAGTVDGQIQFSYTVSPIETESGVLLNFSPEFDKTNEDNQGIIKKLTDYYGIFYKYWRDNGLDVNEQ